MVQDKAIPGLTTPVFNGFPINLEAASGAVTLYSGITQITKAGVAVLTLAAPTTDGRVLIFDSTTAQAHTLTITAGLRGAGAGADVLSWGGAIGDGIGLYSYGGFWWPIIGMNTNVTIG